MIGSPVLAQGYSDDFRQLDEEYREKFHLLEQEYHDKFLQLDREFDESWMIKDHQTDQERMDLEYQYKIKFQELDYAQDHELRALEEEISQSHDLTEDQTRQMFDEIFDKYEKERRALEDQIHQDMNFRDYSFEDDMYREYDNQRMELEREFDQRIMELEHEFDQMRMELEKNYDYTNYDEKFYDEGFHDDGFYDDKFFDDGFHDYNDPRPGEIDIKFDIGSSVPGCEESNSCFNPSVLFVDVGETITWYNADTADHTVTSGTATSGPDGNFDSGLINPGSTFSVTLTQPGSYPYFSMVHPWAVGKIIVEDSGTGSDTPIHEVEHDPRPDLPRHENDPEWRTIEPLANRIMDTIPMDKIERLWMAGEIDVLLDLIVSETDLTYEEAKRVLAFYEKYDDKDYRDDYSKYDGDRDYRDDYSKYDGYVQTEREYPQYDYVEQHDTPYYDDSNELLLEQRIVELEDENQELRIEISEFEKQLSELNALIMDQFGFILDWMTNQ